MNSKMHFGWVVLVFAAACSGKKGEEAPQTPPPAQAKTQALLRHEYASGDIGRICDDAINEMNAKLQAIVDNKASRDVANTLLAFETALAAYSEKTDTTTFMKYVSTNKQVRTEASECETKVSVHLVTIFARKDLYTALLAVKTSDAGEMRLLSETLKSFEANGLKLPDDKLAQVTELMKKLAEKETQFGENINEDNSELTFSAQELDGVPESVMSRFKKTPDGRFIVTMKTPDYVPVMENAKFGGTRKVTQVKYQNRAAEKNLPLLKEIIHLRQQIAGMMGYKTWADYKTAYGRMAKSGQEVFSFLNGLKAKLAKRAQEDLNALRQLKKKMEPEVQGFYEWDRSYYSYQLKKARYSLDDEQIREYFPAELVIKGMFDVYSKILGVRLEEVKDASVWAPGVKLYRILNASDGALIAHFYTDFIPREGKYSHAAAFNLVTGRRLPDGSYVKPVSAIVANFTPPADGKPSLLTHDEVETTFHEFGHIMHQTLTKAPYASLAGTRVARDFVEAPSQMLENWVWSPEILASLSGHYKDNSKKLPPELLKSMMEARDYNQGLFYTRQLYYALMDMAYHTTKGDFDTTKVQEKLHKEITGLDPVPGGHWEASFGHLMGYDAGYYGYLWSEVYAQDMFTRFEKDGLLSDKVGADYRHVILESGNMQEAADLVTQFLGRKSTRDAFFKKLHIAP